MSNLKYLIKSRGYKRTQITRLHDKVVSNGVNLPLNEKTSIIAKLKTLEDEMSELDKEIGSLRFQESTTDEDFARDMDENEYYANKIIDAISILDNSLSLVNGPPINVGQPAARAANSRLKLPEISLPTYEHKKNESLDEFFRTFEGIVEKFNISSHEKFILLRGQLKAEPLALIDSLQSSQHSYEEAKQLLCMAFASDTIKRFDAIKRLSCLKLKNGDSPYTFVGEMRTIQSLFQTLNIEVKDLLQYFFWSSMPNNLQTQIINISNTNKPSLDQINDNIFEAVERYMEVAEFEQTKRSKGKDLEKAATFEKVSTHAVDINYKPKNIKFCSCCSVPNGNRVDSHLTKDCDVYKTSNEKIKKLRNIGASTKCGFVNHRTSDCRFKFLYKCISCSGDHMSYLCHSYEGKNDQSKNSDKRRVKGEKVSSGLVNLTVNHSFIGGNAVLPTFSAFVKGSKIRCMKDSGCQANIIKESTAIKLNLPVMEDNYLSL